MKKTTFTDLGWGVDPNSLLLSAPAPLESWDGYSVEGNESEPLLVIEDAEVASAGMAHAGHRKAVDWLLENEKRVHQAIVTAVLAHLPAMKRKYEELEIEDPAFDAKTLDELREVISPAKVYIFPHAKDGLPYFGFDFDCAWDPEHGFKVMLHGATVFALEVDECGTYEVEEHGGAIA
jgi:hypothetical protein